MRFVVWFWFFGRALFYYFENLDRKHSYALIGDLTAGRCFSAPWSHPSAAAAERWDRGDGEESGNWSALTETTSTEERKSRWAQAVFSETTFHGEDANFPPVFQCSGAEAQQFKCQAGLSVYFWYLRRSATPSLSATGKRTSPPSFPTAFFKNQKKRKVTLHRLLNRTQSVADALLLLLHLS